MLKFYQVLIVFFLSVGVARAGEPIYIELLSENDFWSWHGTDRYYTNGGGLSATLRGEPLTLFGWLKDVMLSSTASPNWSTRYSVAQQMFTPARINVATPIFGDRPYAGWMYGSVTINGDVRRNSCTSFADCIDNSIELQLGVVGPASQADDTQATWHRWFGLQRPLGWVNQIRNEPGILVRWAQAYPVRQTWGNHFSVELAPAFETAVGNIAIYGKGGTKARIGFNFDDEVMRGAWSADNAKSSVYVFGEAYGIASAHNIFLAGNTFRKNMPNTPTVSQKVLMSEFKTGAVITLGVWRLSYTHVWKSREFDGQIRAHRYGGVTFGGVAQF